MMPDELYTWCQMVSPFVPFLSLLIHGPPSLSSHLQQFVEVLDVTLLQLLRRDLRLFEMDVFVVKCLREDKDRSRVKENLCTVRVSAGFI